MYCFSLRTDEKRSMHSGAYCSGWDSSGMSIRHPEKSCWRTWTANPHFVTKVNSKHSTTPHLGFPGRGDFLCSFSSSRSNTIQLSLKKQEEWLIWRIIWNNLKFFLWNSENQRFWLHSWQKGTDSLGSKVLLNILKIFSEKQLEIGIFSSFKYIAVRRGTNLQILPWFWVAVVQRRYEESKIPASPVAIRRREKFLWKHRKMSVSSISNT